MEQRAQILDELQKISPLLAQVPVNTPFRVPSGYFDNLPAMVMDRVQDPFLSADHQLNAFKVPQGYFESLAGNILEKIGANEVRTELETIAPLLNQISRKNPYELPAGYFEQLQALPPKKEARVVPFRRARRWMQYAAAAVISGILVTGAFLYTDSGSDLRNDKTDVPAELNKLSAGELVNYLDNPEHPQTASSDVAADVKNNIHAVSDEELDQYLTEHADELTSTATN
ncbi:MAG: hypothetical protein JO301_14800 [Chitinophagaceae bacterium]|nr:hypothetical protein [Chitinophagaceae bacterium]